ncbi:MAG: hypothetical protein ACYSU1_02075 [Planctomycetota bacterium]|jgi:chorismate mutase
MKNSSFRFHLQQLDLALLALLQERARLCADTGKAPDPVTVEDLLRRADGALPAETLRTIFKELDAACGAGVPDRGGRA